jgi:hypothetical protein
VKGCGNTNLVESNQQDQDFSDQRFHHPASSG